MDQAVKDKVDTIWDELDIFPQDAGRKT